MTPLVAIVCALLLSGAAAFHVFWGLGGRLGMRVAVPQGTDGRKVMSPGPVACMAVAVVLLAMVLLVAELSGVVVLALPSILVIAAGALCGIVFLARALSWHTYVGFFKRVRSTPFARYDTWLFCPICLVLGLGMTWLTYGFWQGLI